MATSGPPPSTRKNLGSFYKRPSAAIERGGGFFIPGLQGFRLRLVFGGVILGLLSLDGLVRPGMTTTQLVSTTMAALAAIALLSQAFLEQRKEKAVQMRRDAIAAASGAVDGGKGSQLEGDNMEISFFDEKALGDELTARTRWAADILLQLTPACSFVAFSEERVLARAGATGEQSDDSHALATASAKAAEGQQGSSVVVTRTSGAGDQSNSAEGVQGTQEATLSPDGSIMSLLPSICQQGLVCRTPSPLGEAVSGGAVTTVLLGSTLRGTGVFSGQDAAWFERVCAHLFVPERVGAGEQ